MSQRLYRQYLELLKLFRADPSRKGKCLGEALRLKVSQTFREGDRTALPNLALCEGNYNSLQRLVNNIHLTAHPRVYSSTATGLTAEQCSLTIHEYLHKDKEKQEGSIGSGVVKDQEQSVVEKLKEHLNVKGSG